MGKMWNEIRTNEDIAESCEDAADLLEGHWCTGEWYRYWEEEYYDANGIETYTQDNHAYCLEGAMAAAIGLEVNDLEGDSYERQRLLACPVYNAVLDTLNLQLIREGADGDTYGEGDLPNWNDNAADEQSAVDLLRATAKRMHGVPL